MNIELWTDGSVCEKNKSSGWACIFTINNKIIKKLSGKKEYEKTSDIEIIAVIEGLKYYNKFYSKKCRLLDVYTDSKHIYEVVENNYWCKWGNEKFTKYWEQLKFLLSYYPKNQIKFNWIPSHSGYYLNELADKTAKKARN